MARFGLRLLGTLAAACVVWGSNIPWMLKGGGSVTGFDTGNHKWRKTTVQQAFKQAKTLMIQPEPGTEPPEDRPYKKDPLSVWVLLCKDRDFKDCLGLGAPLGACVSFFEYNAEGSTEISDYFNDNVTSIATSHDKPCQMHKFKHCNNKFDDPGLSIGYSEDLRVDTAELPNASEYDNEITSWRC